MKCWIFHWSISNYWHSSNDSLIFRSILYLKKKTPLLAYWSQCHVYKLHMGTVFLNYYYYFFFLWPIFSSGSETWTKVEETKIRGVRANEESKNNSSTLTTLESWRIHHDEMPKNSLQELDTTGLSKKRAYFLRPSSKNRFGREIIMSMKPWRIDGEISGTECAMGHKL